MFPIEIIHQKAAAAALDYLLIGGHALNAYGTPRATADVDFLVRKRDRERWAELLALEGFRIFHDGGNFLQLSPPYGVPWSLDLMLVPDASFDNLATDATEVETLGLNTKVPGPLHLIALKLHAIKHGPATRKHKDFADILTLAKAANLDGTENATKAVFEKHGTAELYHEFLRTTGE